MRALCWFGVGDVRVENVPDPEILNPRDIIIRVTSTAVCGSDLHLFNGFVPTMLEGDILGHEAMGEVVEVGPGVKNLAIGDRVVVPFPIACGNCFFCRRELYSLCDNTNPNASILALAFGHSTAGIFGYSHLYGGYAGGQAEYLRVPFGDVGPLKIDRSMPDEKVLFLSDVFPTGYMAAENCDIEPDDTVAVWGAGAVGLFAMMSARLLGAARIIVIDRFPERLDLAASWGGAETINYENDDVYERLMEMTGGYGPDACIDAVGLEAHGTSVDALYDKAKQAVRLTFDRLHVLRQAIRCCRKGGVLSLPGVYGGLLDKFPMGAAFAKGLTFRMGQTHVHRYMRPLLERIERGEIDPSFVISHRMQLEEAPIAYEMFREKEHECVKVVLSP